ncbi:MAG: hypothetical protein HRU38_02535 [Saccharospirillaceae bacterium]|nr:hypothetical protein [Pseudomonadales bacterium]NRB77538.1 hypothetical protein [Saccharospirillaceae bacterium]
MLARILIMSLSVLFLISCKLHVNVSGLETELTLIEVNTGETITLVNNNLVSFDHNFTALDYFEVKIDQSSGQTCHLVYKSGRFTTAYNELEVNCQPITNNQSCSTDANPICARVDENLNCVIGEPCLTQRYHTFQNQCDANTSGLNPIFIGLDECSVIDNIRTTNDTPAIFVSEPKQDVNINVLSAVFDGDYVTVTFEHLSSCNSDIYALNVNKFAANASTVQWAITYKESCTLTTSLEKTMTFDLMPIRDWYSQQNGGTTGSINLSGIGSYSF